MRFKINEISDDLKSNHDFDFKIKIVPISGVFWCSHTSIVNKLKGVNNRKLSININLH